MADKPFKGFTVNGRYYRIDVIPPDEIFSFGLKVVKVVAPMLGGLENLKLEGEKKEKIFSLIAEGSKGYDASQIEAVCIQARDYVITPEMTYLRDPATRNSWFTKYPLDIMPVPIWAAVEIAKDFLLPMLTTIGQNLILTDSQSASQSPMAGK